MQFPNLHNRFAIAMVVMAAALALPAVSSARKANTTETTPTGKQFIANAAEINLDEIELGKVAEQKGSNPAVRDFGKRMAEDHSALETKLQGTAKTEGVTLPTKPDPEAASLDHQLSSEAGSKFDDSYIRHMLAWHKQAINDFEYEIEHGKTPAIKAYAESALPVIQDHIRIAEDVAGKMQLSGSAGLEKPNKAIAAN